MANASMAFSHGVYTPREVQSIDPFHCITLQHGVEASRVSFNPGAWLEERKAVRKSESRLAKVKRKSRNLDLLHVIGWKDRKANHKAGKLPRKVNQGSHKS